MDAASSTFCNCNAGFPCYLSAFYIVPSQTSTTLPGPKLDGAQGTPSWGGWFNLRDKIYYVPNVPRCRYGLFPLTRPRVRSPVNLPTRVVHPRLPPVFFDNERAKSRGTFILHPPSKVSPDRAGMTTVL
ncbi:hypothetical protein MGG_15573 [Pyricularia oryzae 70-15]|uniref:Uncharacterized protein n=2 Tax=Pyricularia oryzae TaxID=318829 RepID=G4MTT7_PYRO7|nr:uncharacterized protein MGG_15573 [Pyricularia oryzae 70-15]EHA53926.1 hypothetical protein MGG_15573 [Pyricularia oryzae 70-15]KAI7926422.1 hypothetical protein M9X92_002768 [Pyricularia oryzae]KAI7929802.1 hypothetical protein M0657_001949 [Pyricularia oryzae]QBZ55575.1 hypothetical protein PoMZ_00474 [Pyricularia oryzae]